MARTIEQRERSAIERLLAEARTNVELDWMPDKVDANTPYAADIIGFRACTYYGFRVCAWYGDFRTFYTQWDDNVGCDFERSVTDDSPFLAVYRMVAIIEEFAAPIEPEDAG